MIKIEKVVTASPEQWKIILEGMRNPKNSWNKSDSYSTVVVDSVTDRVVKSEFFMGDKDNELARTLAGGGPVHGKFLRMIPVWLNITAPLYWWKEFDTYKVGTVANSCSTMHKLTDKEFTLDDFSCEHLSPGAVNDYDIEDSMDILFATTAIMNLYRERYLKIKANDKMDEEARKELMKKYWWQMIQLLPSSYNQKRTIFLNYEVLANIYLYRKDHKLDEWRTFCEWIETLPYSELITGEVKE